MNTQLKAPFPWFGGKSRAAEIIWSRLGDTPNYVEPFAGSLAVLLGRPHEPRTETVNDLDCYLTNFWRAIAMSPDATAEAADWPVNEADLLARHRWLLGQVDLSDRLKADPHFHDPKIAGFWVWGLCSWIGSGWCVNEGKASPRIPHLGDAGRGINRKLPYLGDAGRGINRKLPYLGDAGRGINRKLPHLGDAGRGIADYFSVLSNRLRKVRVACGEWDRVLGDACTIKHGLTAIVLDPPYSADMHSVKYSADSDISPQVREWAVANGNNPLMRICLCGYEGEHAMPSDWECVPWRAQGGFGNRSEGLGRENAHKERLWFSPHCIKPEMELF
jgi:hypothetical protein